MDFARGIARGAEDAIKPIVLVVRIKAHTIEGEPYETQYRFEANPFWQGQSGPLYVSSHFRELPMYPAGDDLRVARDFRRDDGQV